MTAANCKKACVIGWPITHSRSPLIHGYWLKTYGIEGTYTKDAVRPEELDNFLATLGTRGLAGCNVTVPHKEAAFAIAHFKEPSAIAVGAANTIWLQGGEIACANTDTYGFMTNLNLAAPQWRDGAGPILVLGAGGSARAIVYGFLDAGVRDVRVFNRSAGRSTALVRHFGTSVSAHAWDSIAAHIPAASMIVNTTTLGMKGNPDLNLDLTAAKPACVVADLVYVPLETPLLRRARQRGLAAVDGLGMLLHQAVPGFEKWFAVRPDVTAELRALVAADIAAASGC